MTAEEYYFFEWLIIEKRMTSEAYSKLSNKEIHCLLEEYGKFKKQLNKL
jgi:hypothetical protein